MTRSPFSDSYMDGFKDAELDWKQYKAEYYESAYAPIPAAPFDRSKHPAFRERTPLEIEQAAIKVGDTVQLIDGRSRGVVIEANEFSIKFRNEFYDNIPTWVNRSSLEVRK